MVGTGRGAQLGVLIKGGEALELAGKLDALVFDKTGTLTVGRPVVRDVINLDKRLSKDDILGLAAAAEGRSEHPLAEALVQEAAASGLAPMEVNSFTAVTGRGIKAVVNERNILIGNRTFMEEEKVEGLGAVESKDMADRLAAEGKTVLHMAVDGKMAAFITIADALKEESPETVHRLRDMGLRVIMLTGDQQATAQAIAREAGISEVLSQVLPHEKAEKIVSLQKEGLRVAMVGDGINDAPAMAQADVGIAMGSGVDVAIESGDIVLMSGELTGVLTALSLSRATMANIRQNLFWAFAYNVIGIPVAAGLLYIFGGPTLNPMIAGGAMALSSVSVVSNALRLRFFKMS